MNIFLAALIKSKDIKQFWNDVSLKLLVHELNVLEKEGLTILTPHGNFLVHFLLGLVLGDNLGLNSILEFSKSFSSNYSCRICKCHKNVCQEFNEENVSYLRNIENYSEYVKNMMFSSDTGVNKESILNIIHSFHFTKNYCVNIKFINL